MELTLHNISLNFSSKTILNSIDLHIGQGELISLLGPSGCGKSTLLKTIAGLLTPNDGDILINREKVNHIPSNLRGAVIVFQDLRLFPHMTVEENIAFPLKIRGVAKEKRIAKARQLLQSVQLPGYENRKISAMSGGQLQRVALARALAADPKILLLDEPFSSLDDNLRQDMRNLVLQLHAEYGMTTVLVTHDQQEALMMSHRIAVMLNGEIAQYDTPQTIFHQPVNKAVADYLGGGNYIQGRVEKGRFTSEVVSFATDKPDGSYLALFRPKALRPLASGNYRVADIRYRGDQWDITVQGLKQKFLLACDSEQRWQINDFIGIDFDPAKAILINN